MLAAYDSKKHGTGVDLLVRLTNIQHDENGGSSKDQDEPRVVLPQKVVICSHFDLESFKAFVGQRGATGFLKLPI